MSTNSALFLPVAAILLACLAAGCSGSTNSPSNTEQTPVGTPVPEISNDEIPANDATNAIAPAAPSEAESEVPTQAATDSPAVAAPEAPNTENPLPASAEPTPTIPVADAPPVLDRTLVTFDITVPAYQSEGLRVELFWGETTVAAMWVGDEYWTTSTELPTNSEHLLTVTFSDRNGDIELAQFSEPYRTGTNAAQSFQLQADQFDATQFDDDRDGVNNLDELIAGTDPSIDEDSLLEIGDYYSLANISTSRMSVSLDFESRLTEDRPYYDTVERLPVEGGYPGTDRGTVDIDADGNGTRIFSRNLQGTVLELSGTRTNLGNAITWEGTRYAYDDYGHRVSFTNTVAVVDEKTRTYVEDVLGTNIGTYYYGWEVTSNLTGHVVEGTSYCEPVAGTVSVIYRENTGGNTVLGTNSTTTTINKDIDDPYWRVVRVNSENETSEYFVRELHIYSPYANTNLSDVEPRHKYFICDFVDF